MVRSELRPGPIIIELNTMVSSQHIWHPDFSVAGPTVCN